MNHYSDTFIYRLGITSVVTTDSNVSDPEMTNPTPNQEQVVHCIHNPGASNTRSQGAPAAHKSDRTVSSRKPVPQDASWRQDAAQI